MGKAFTDEHKQHISEAKIGKPHPHKGSTHSRRGWKLSDVAKKHIGEAAKGRPKSLDTRQKLSDALKGNKNGVGNQGSTGRYGENANNWHGGTSNKPYCYLFSKQLKEEVREAFGRKCFICGASENGRKLNVHHCDYNKGQGCGHKWALVPLCTSCHMKTNGHRYYYFNLLANYWALNPEINFS